MGNEPVYRSILALDVEHFTRAAWTDPIRVRVRARLHRLLDHALAQARVDPAQAHRGDTGDGVLLLVAAEVPTTRLLHPLMPVLAEQLTADNQEAPAAQRLRMRLAVHAGEVIADPYGHTGQAINHVARLLNAQVGRAILDAVPETDVVLLVSEQVHDGVVRHAYDGIDPAGYQPVWVTEKETSARAWAHLPGRPAQPELARLPKVAVAPSHGPPAQATPRELPRHVQEFTGRQPEVGWLLEAVEEPVDPGSAVVLAIDGMGGIGKSALAIHVAHRLADAFPDGQLYLDLRGATPGMAPLEERSALDRLLQSLGVPADQVAADVDGAAARWRSVAAGRRLLVVLDNAATAAQVAPLLPASASCAVLVTSRRVLSTLGGARHLHLDALDPSEAVELLARLAGPERISAEPSEAVELVRLCGYLPLAVRLAGARAARRPAWPLRALVDRLTELRRLDELRDEHVGVRASMQVSYQELHDSSDPVDRRAAQAFRLLGVVDTPDIGVPVAAWLLDEPEADAEWVLELLVDAQLLQTPTPSRYRLHDLLRLYAREQTARHDPEPVRLAALARVLARYLATARQASHLVQPADRRRAGTEADRAGALPLPGRAGALGWLEVEQANLLAVAQQAAGLADRLAATTVHLAQAVLWGMEVRARYRDWEALVRLAVPVARRLGDDHGYAHLLADLGHVSWRLAQFDAARVVLAQALALFETLGDCDGRVRALNGVGVVHQRQGHMQAARASLEEALRLQRECGNRHGEAGVLGNLGVFCQETGELSAATTYHEQALVIMREIGDRQGEGAILTNLGEVSVEQGSWPAAISFCEQAIQIARELGERNIEVYARNTRGEAYRRAGDPSRAAGDQQAALAVVRETGDRYGEAVVLWHLGLTFRDLHQRQRAQSCWKDALAILEEFGSAQAEDVRRLLEDADGGAGGEAASYR